MPPGPTPAKKKKKKGLKFPPFPQHQGTRCLKEIDTHQFQQGILFLHHRHHSPHNLKHYITSVDLPDCRKDVQLVIPKGSFAPAGLAPYPPEEKRVTAHKDTSYTINREKQTVK